VTPILFDLVQERGLIDGIVPRKELKDRLVYYLSFLLEGQRRLGQGG